MISINFLKFEPCTFECENFHFGTYVFTYRVTLARVLPVVGGLLEPIVHHIAEVPRRLHGWILRGLCGPGLRDRLRRRLGETCACFRRELLTCRSPLDVSSPEEPILLAGL